MKNLFFVISICLLLSASGCNFLVPTEKYEALQTENNSLTSQIQELQTQIGQLQAQNTALEEKITERREQETVDPFDEKILGSLFLRPDLILSRGIHGQELHPEQGGYNEREKEYAITHARLSIWIQPVQYLPDTHQQEAEKQRSRCP